MGLVPALVINGKNLTENPAVLAYIASLKPESKMLGATDWERAKVLEWRAWLSGTLHGNGVAAATRPYRFTDEESAFPGIKKKGMEKVANCIETIDAKVDKAHAVREQVTVVDFFLHVIWRWAGILQVDRSKYPRFREVARNVERSQGMKGALVDEELPLEWLDGCRSFSSSQSKLNQHFSPLSLVLLQPPNPKSLVLPLSGFVEVSEEAHRAPLLVPRASHISICYPQSTSYNTHSALFQSLNFFSCSTFQSGSGSFFSRLKILRSLRQVVVDEHNVSFTCCELHLVEDRERLDVSTATLFESFAPPISPCTVCSECYGEATCTDLI